MRSLLHSLLDRDMGFLRIITELWGFDPPTGSLREAASDLAEDMLLPGQIDEIIAALPSEAVAALETIIQQDGKLPWQSWERVHGAVRAMGAGRRDREHPWREPTSTSEIVWYRGLLGRAFLDSTSGPQEFAYVPREFFEHLKTTSAARQSPVLVPVVPPDHPLEAAATILDDCATLLAALRRQSEPSQTLSPARRSFIQTHLFHADSIDLCLALARNLDLLVHGSLETDSAAVREFLLADRMISLRQLYTTWKSTVEWNDLAALPHLQPAGGSWPNDPVLARDTITLWLGQLQVGAWYPIASLIQAIYDADPAFQRPGGTFDTWYLMDVDGVRLDGIEHWYAVEGALLRNLLRGPLRWFGVIQLGREHPEGPVTRFSPTRLSTLLEDSQAILPKVKESEKATFQADGLVSLPRLAPRSMRYQVARFLDWEGLRGEDYRYRLSIRAVNEARDQGLDLAQVKTILAQAADTVPPSIEIALDRYGAQAYQAQIVEHFVLRVSDPELMRSLLSHSSSRKLIQEQLNEMTALVQKKHWPRLIQAAARMGILIDSPPGHEP